jgi:hypothetical protein
MAAVGVGGGCGGGWGSRGHKEEVGVRATKILEAWLRLRLYTRGETLALHRTAVICGVSIQ